MRVGWVHSRYQVEVLDPHGVDQEAWSIFHEPGQESSGHADRPLRKIYPRRAIPSEHPPLCESLLSVPIPTGTPEIVCSMTQNIGGASLSFEERL